MKRRKFVKASGLTFIGMQLPIPQTIEVLPGWQAFAVRALKWLGTTVGTVLVEKTVEWMFDGGSSCAPCQDKRTYWTTNRGLSYRPPAPKPKPPSMPGASDKYTAFAYGKVNPNGAAGNTKTVFMAKNHDRKEVAVLLPEDAVFSLCCVANMLMFDKWWLDADREEDLQFLQKLLLPTEITAQSDKSNSITFNTKHGKFQFLGNIIRNKEGKPLAIDGECILYPGKTISEERYKDFYEKIPIEFDKTTGSLDFIFNG